MRSKRDWRDLAVCGGSPAFTEPIHVGRPNVGDRQRFLARVNDILDRRWLTNDGPYVREFEAAVAALHGVRECVCMSNGTVALEIATRACGMAGEVIVPSFTFIATAHALSWQGIKPVFCDIEPLGHHIDPGLIDELITSRTTGIVAVHIWGRPCDTQALEQVAGRHGLKLVFDAAHAFLCSERQRMIGGSGDCEILSFHATKVLNTLEGGAVLTNDEELASRMRLMRNFGFRDYDDVGYSGTNGKMNEVSAAMGLTLLESIDEILEANKTNFELYREGLAQLPGVQAIPYESAERRNFQYVVVLIDESRAGLDRDSLLSALWAENILARRYFYPGCHRARPYLDLDPHVDGRLPITNDVAHKILLLPTGTSVQPEDVATVIDVIGACLRHPAHVSSGLGGMGFQEERV